MNPRMVEADIQHAGEHWVIVPRCGEAKVSVINTTGREVLRHCDGATDLPEICERVGAAFNKLGEDVRADVEAFLNEAAEADIIETDITR